MVEKALLYALIALALVVAVSAVTTAFGEMTDRMVCAWEKAEICYIDGKDD